MGSCYVTPEDFALTTCSGLELKAVLLPLHHYHAKRFSFLLVYFILLCLSHNNWGGESLSTNKPPKGLFPYADIYISCKLLLTVSRTKLMQIAHSRHGICLIKANEVWERTQYNIHRSKRTWDQISQHPCTQPVTHLFVTFYSEIFTRLIMTHLINILQYKTLKYSMLTIRTYTSYWA